MRVDITPPNGYTYVLYQTIRGSRLLGLAATEEQVYSKYQLHKKTKVKPTNVVQLIKKFGHGEANKLLKQFGSSWCTKNGNIYYKPIEEKAA